MTDDFYMNTVADIYDFDRGKSRGVVDAAVSAYTTAEAGQSFELFFRQSPQPMWLYALDTLKFLKVNPAAVAKYGFTNDEFLSMTIVDLRPPDEVDRLRSYIKTQRKRPNNQKKTESRYWRHLLKNGDVIWVDIYTQIFNYEGQNAALIVAVDVTTRKNMQDRLDVQRAYFRQLFDSSSEGIVLVDREENVIDANKGFMTLFGYTLPELVDHCVDDFIVPEALKDQAVSSWHETGDDGYFHQEVKRQRKDGALLDVVVSGYAIEHDSMRLGTYLIYHDLTERKRLLETIQYHTTHSAATGLINRAEFERRLDESVDDGSVTDYAFLHIALNQFKLIHQSCGHSAAEKLLKLATKAIKPHIGDNTIGHVYHDEFSIALRDTSRETAEVVARRIVSDIAAIRFQWDGKVWRVGAAIGGAIAGDAAGDVRTLLSTAEMACRIAREKGGANRIYFAALDDRETLKRQDEVRRLVSIREALAADRFMLYGQKIVPVNNDVDEGQCDYEILLRMLDVDDAVLSPAQFIPVAERFRLMEEIDRWVIEHVLATLGEAAARGQAFKGEVSINLSGETLGDDTFHNFVADRLRQHRVTARHICFEITETAAIRNIDSAKTVIRSLRAMGAKVALDDFGSGMSSFRYLRELDVDYLKIDGLFVKDIASNGDDRAMTEAIARMAQTLDIETVAEYVENQKTLDCLKELGVDYAQGFGIHRPEPWPACIPACCYEKE
ncbi:MAG TPA: EAL domain-containing protein [Gammaproteobacteria bacterium]|nr:EAL domain-containing protein [Gammaproteobacteria bacterium]